MFMIVFNNMVDASRMSRRMRRRNARRITKLYNNIICEYANITFDLEPNTCPVPPVAVYKNIYEKSYKEMLWQFRESVCLPQQIDYIMTFVVWITVTFGTLLFLIAFRKK
jgi:hypothetical protein